MSCGENSQGGYAGGLQELLEYVKDRRAIDFTAYRPNTIKRRLELRLSAIGMPDYDSYRKYIIENPKELDYLVDALTIKVSYFFRNPLVFELLREVVLPELIEKGRNDILRIWCAGCARGEEAYSVAILLTEITGKEVLPSKFFIIGTDIDKEAIEDARKARYKADSVSEVKKGHLDKYFAFKDDLYRLHDEIKSLVTFAYHDVTTLTTPKEGIFSDYHLILCRNVLIYFNRELSEKIFNGFSGFILRNGYLILGEAETFMPQLTKDYEGIMRGTKIFRKR